VAQDGAGNIYVAGGKTGVGGVVWRLTPELALDAAFGQDGAAQFTLSGNDDNAILLDGAGKILTLHARGGDAVVRRLLP